MPAGDHSPEEDHVVSTGTSTATAPTEDLPRRRAVLVVLSCLAGFLLTVVWSAEFVDQTIGANVANTLLGQDTEHTPIVGAAAGIAFAFVSGLAGTFTACNIAAFGTMGSVLTATGNRRQRMAATLRPLGWMSLGLVVVSASYGALVGLVGTAMPQFSTAPTTAGELPPRLVQAMLVFGVIGLVMCYLGLAAVRVVPDPFSRIRHRLPHAPMVLLGALIGGFLIGRPFPLFRQMFHDAAESGSPLYGAAAFTLQSLANVLLLALLLLLLAAFAGGRVHRWLTAKPSRGPAITATAMLVAGSFLVLYWDVRILARYDFIPWYPMAPWT
ncbi:hypothetical protein ABT324_02545 [Saccharopolyspora sp. NPDC000359]|uniref:hypothetical protein n=1 Tax=Saccharopolyspora sp. NPDC000359 TaxID=3154251 RepID=UPI00332AD13A